MNSTYNFNPDEKRMQLAALLQDPTQPYKRYSGPMGAPKSGGGGMNDMMMKMMMQGKRNAARCAWRCWRFPDRRRESNG
jgi:hypothetical protein